MQPAHAITHQSICGTQPALAPIIDFIVMEVGYEIGTRNSGRWTYSGGCTCAFSDGLCAREPRAFRTHANGQSSRGGGTPKRPELDAKGQSSTGQRSRHEGRDYRSRGVERDGEAKRTG